MRIFHIAETSDPNAVDLQGSNLIVYHRTKNQDIAGNICSIGFIAGGGAAYGKGIYTTYNLKSSLKNYNLSTYGGQLLKAMVDINGFLILDYDISKLVYGDNYRLIDQIKNVIGEDKIINRSLGKQRQWDLIQSHSDELSTVKYRTAGIAASLSGNFRLDSSGVNGIIFTGNSDGRVCVAYKELLVTPLSHAWVDGKTYKNPQWTDCGKRSTEELMSLRNNEVKAESFRKDRKVLLSELSRLSENGTINLDPSDFPSISKVVFEEAMANFLYEDESRIQRLSPQLRTDLKDIIDIELLIKKLKSAPTLHWKEWLKVDQSIKDKIPQELIIGIWEDFILKNHGYWDKVPEDIKSIISNTSEIKYWTALIRKNSGNWAHVPSDLIPYLQEESNLTPPDNIATLKQNEERVSETEEIEIPSSSMGWVQDEIAKMNKRAGRLGLKPIQHEIVSEDPKSRTQKVKIIGNVPFLRGWKLIARVSRVTNETGEEYNAVETLSDQGLPKNMDLENSSMDCQHCGHNRKRKECYVVKNEGSEDKKYQIGQYLMIGSTCLGDFVGDIGGDSSPESIAKYAQQFRQMITLFKEGSEYKDKTDDDIRKGFKKKGVPLVFFLGKVMQLEKQYGFVGRKEAYQNGKESTANLAWEMCTDLSTDQKYSKGVDASDLATIYSALSWVSSIPEPEQAGDKKSDFLWNIKKNCESGIVTNKKKSGNVGIIAWLPTAYKRAMEEKTDYKLIIGEKEDEIWFSGIVNSKKPVLVQVSQQVQKGSTITRNYIIANGDGKTVAWFEDVPIQANINEPIFVKGKVESNAFVDNKSATILKNVVEISKEEYERYKPVMDQRLKDFEKKNEIPEGKGIVNSNSPKGDYVSHNGKVITEEYKITNIRPAQRGQQLYFLQDKYGKRVSAFTSLSLGKVDDIIMLSGTVQINGQYINLLGIQLADNVNNGSANVIAPPQPSAVAPYQNGQDVEDTFTISAAKPANYGNTLYNLLDSSGRKVSAFIKGNIGSIGDTVRLRAKISLNGNYINLQRVHVVPKTATPPNKPMPTTTPSATLPIQPIGTQGVDANSHQWYKISKLIDFVPDFLKRDKNIPQDNIYHIKKRSK